MPAYSFSRVSLARCRSSRRVLRSLRFSSSPSAVARSASSVTPFKVGKLAEDVGLDGWKVINRMADAEHAGAFDGLARKLGLSEAEKDELAFAYAFERRPGEVRAAEQHA